MKGPGGILSKTLNTRVLKRFVPVGSAKAIAGIGRILLALTVVLLVTTPLTQHVWSWDHFLRGGQDYESSALLLLSFLSLVLVLGQQCKQCVSTFFAVRRWRVAVGEQPRLAGSAELALSFWPSGNEASPGLATYSLPLQI